MRVTSAKSILTLAVMLLAGPAFADLRGTSTNAPLFSSDEMTVINRNQALSQMLELDPWVVRALLDSISDTRGTTEQTRESIVPLPPREQIDSSADPDLEGMQRASPEAIHDLFQLLKRAGEKSKDKTK